MGTESEEVLSPTKRALLALKQMQSKLAALELAQNEPIAIVGMGCRFPGAEHPEAFWHLLQHGIDAITEVPKNRWDINAYYDSDPNTPGKMYTRYGGFVPHLQEFDAQFFRISPREAASLDPQQRLLLEVSWEALEHSSIAPEQLVGSQTGVFVGICGNDYWHRLLSRKPAEIDAYLATGNSHSIASGRLSYILGCTGPSLSVDTACSSSLVAVHLAVMSLRNKECNLALAGGVNRILLPEVSINFSKARMLSPDSHCRTFDALADGFVRAEGCGLIVLKRLSDALASGNNILALIRGSAVNHDGRTSGLTVPNGPAQQAIIRQALNNSQVEPAQVSYVETHGTATSLGDPIEVGALGAVFAKERPPEQPLAIGSVKTNIGHLEAAAGIASLIKVVLTLQHEEIPPHLHFHKPNPHINWDELPVIVLTERTPWTRGEKQRLAGVSSFGFSGTNAHVVLEEAPESRAAVEPKLSRPLHVLTLSAKNEKALQELAQRYTDFLLAHLDVSLPDVCFTANTGRSHFNHRLSVVASSTQELQKKLATTTEQQALGVFQGRVQDTNRAKVAFLFAGQGSHYVDMGRQLYQTQPTFRQALERCDQILRPYLDKPLSDVLYPQGVSSQESALFYNPQHPTPNTQPALFALEYALFELWKSWGIEPSAVMGDDVGEYVAAVVTGVISLEDGLKLIVAREKLMQALMASNQVAGTFKPMLANFEAVTQELSYSKPQIQLISNVTGEVATEIKPNYWCRPVRQPMFKESIKTLYQAGYEVFVEIGTDSTLLEMGQQYLPDKAGVWLPSLHPKKGDWQQILESLVQLYMLGVPVDWSGFDRDYYRHLVVLPTYPFQRQRYWIETT